MQDEPGERFLEILRRHLMYYEATDELSMDQNLLELGLDSMGKVQLIIELEEEFGIIVPDELLVERYFDTAGSILDLVTKLMARTTGAVAAEF